MVLSLNNIIEVEVTKTKELAFIAIWLTLNFFF